jgi:quercetin dioxygenase-like cupin family protein
MENILEKAKIKGADQKGLHEMSLQMFDLPGLINNLKQNELHAKGELNAMFLLKRADKQIVLASLPKGTKIKSFLSNDFSTFQIIEGKLKIHNRKETVILDKGQLLTLQENVKCHLTTKSETVFLLTIANGSFQTADISKPGLHL